MLLPVIFVGALAHTAAARQVPAVTGVPAVLPGTPIPPPPAPSIIAWTVGIPAAPNVSPILTAKIVVAGYLPGIVAGFDRADGRQVWTVELTPEQPLVTDGSFVFVAAAGAVHAVQLSDGRIAWSSPSGALTAPMVVKEGWLVAATGGKLTARRTTDGTPVWTVDAAAQREAAAITGDVLFVPQTDRRLVARNLLSGQVIWERRFGGQPEEPLAIGNRLYVGASDKMFYCVDAASGEIEWPVRVGATIRGRAASDGERVYFVALDNLIRALDRINGAVRWHKGVPFRPWAGPIVANGSVFIAGPGAELRVLTAATGAPGTSVRFPGQLALNPGVLQTEEGAIFAAVTGSLAEAWKLSLTLPIGPAQSR